MNGNYGRTDEIMPLNKAVKTFKKALAQDSKEIDRESLKAAYISIAKDKLKTNGLDDIPVFFDIREETDYGVYYVAESCISLNEVFINKICNIGWIFLKIISSPIFNNSNTSIDNKSVNVF